MKTTKKKPTRKTKASEPRRRRAAKPTMGSGDRAEAELVVVHVANGQLAAEVAKGKLESEGIEAMLQPEAQSVFPMTVEPMGEVQVLVRAEDARRARKLLKT